MKTVMVDSREVSVEDAFQLALKFLGEGQYAAMEAICTKIVEAEPDHYRAHHGIGLGLHRRGASSTEAITHIRKALELNPAYFEAHNNLGNILCETGKLEEALESYLRAETLRPEAAVVHFNIATVIRALGRETEAVARYDRAVAIDPAYKEAHAKRAHLLYEMGRFGEAADGYLAFVTLCPDDCSAMYGAGMALSKAGRVDEALQWFRKTISCDPGSIDAHLALGNILAGRVSRWDYSALEEALACYRKVLSVRPEDSRTRIWLGNMILNQGRIDEALHEFSTAMHYAPDLAEARSCYLNALQYHPATSLPELYRESVRWDEIFGAPVPKVTNHGNRRDPERPLRIGYVSGDFCRHPVGFHVMPALYHHDAERFEVYCYSNFDHVDIYTTRLRISADVWRPIAGLPDETVQEMILADGIDILVDLAGHTSRNRLFVFARKPAPVQVSWIGYYFSTGLTEIDYILMDDAAVLPGEERWFSEKVIKLPGSRFCYEPPPYAPEVAPLPLEENGRMTFGSFNKLAKMTPQVVKLWARILHAVPDSRFLVKSPVFRSAIGREHFVRMFAAEGVPAERLILREQSDHVHMLAEYADMDLALDPFPFNGGITSCEALWMGVPVLTLTGNRPIARQTAGFLKAIGLTEFIAQSEEEYLSLACRFAENCHELASIRKRLRKLMSKSMLCNGKRFTANLESIYREMWRAWCKS